MSAKLEVFIRGATHMPALPTMIGKLLSAFNDPRFSVEKLSGIISTDTSLAAKVLKMANSVFYFRQENVSTVKIATVRLGHKTIRSLVLTVWTQTFKTFPLQKSELGLITGLLEHGTATAVGAQLLMQLVCADLAEEAYVAGLLHDIGRLALICQLGQIYEAEILNRAMIEKKDIREIETDVLGFDHAMLGARLLQSWNIPALSVRAAADHHHFVADPATEPVVAAVALADDLVTRKGHNVAEKALCPNRDDLMAFFQLKDLPAFEEQWSTKLQAMTVALERL